MSIGYACLVIGDTSTNLSHCILKNANADKLREITKFNLSALGNIIDYNIKNNISLFRISSDIIPFASHPVNNINWQLEFKDDFQKNGQKIKNAKIRVSMHPGQYTVLNSLNNEIVQKAIADLEYHATFLDALSTGTDNKIVLHIGGVYGDKAMAMGRFIDNFSQLSQNVKQRLVIENDDKNYSVEDVLNISHKIGIPVVFDNLHNFLNPSKKKLTEQEWISLCGKTWKDTDGKQKVHYSQGKSDGKHYAHSDTITLSGFMNFYNHLPDINIDIMLEVKDKNLSAIKCINAVQRHLPIKNIELEWARYKYLVLSSSANMYNEIRNLLKNKDAVVVYDFYAIIEKAIALPEDKGAEINAAQHVWGYVNSDCTESEKKRFIKLINGYFEETSTLKALKNHLFKCAINQNIEYLKKSYYFML